MKKSLLFIGLLSLSLTAFASADLTWPKNDEASVTVFKSLPVLSYQNSFHEGGTGYLDGVKPSDFPENVAAFAFEDKWQRTGIALRYVLEAGDDGETCGSVEPRTGVFASTIFQRFSNSKDTWSIGEHAGAHVLFSSSMVQDSGVNEFSASSLVKLISSGELKFACSYGRGNAVIRLVPAKPTPKSEL